MEQLRDLLWRMTNVPVPVQPEPNFFNLGGAGYLENPTSDLMALFMGGHPRAPRWLAQALLICLRNKGLAEDLTLKDIVWDDVVAEREASVRDSESDTYKRLDIVVTCDQFVLGIENKVLAGARENPFCTYDKLIEDRSRGKPVLRCVVRPTTYSQDVPSHWPVVSYQELVETAFSQFGAIASQPVSKWQFFYAEFLQHLQNLGGSPKGTSMDEKAISFVEANLHQLRRAQQLLEEFDAVLSLEGQETLQRTFINLDVDTDIRAVTQSWPGGQRALRFRPHCWGGASDVVLAYYDRPEDRSISQVAYFVRAYIRQGSQSRTLEDIKRDLTQATKDESHAWFNEEEEEFCWYESNKNWLCFGAYPRDDSREGAFAALSELAQWLHKFAFTAP